MSHIVHKVKILHASNLRNWTRFPEYRDHTGPTLGEYRTKQRVAEDALWVLAYFLAAAAIIVLVVVLLIMLI